MSTIITNPDILQWLHQLKDITECQDANGTLLGVFTPRMSEELLLVEKVKKLVDFEELERRKKEEGGKGLDTAGVLRRLRALESPT